MSALSTALARQGSQFITTWVNNLRDPNLDALLTHWPFWAQAGQRAPGGFWRTWLMLAGRGFGKTRSGAEWVREQAQAGNGDTRIALIAATIDDARAIMVEGDSGLLAIAPDGERPLWEPGRGRLIWPSGAQAAVFSAANPESLRGPQHHFAWADELTKWAYPDESWANLQMGLRLGDDARTVATTTPRPTQLIRTLRSDAATVVTGGSTHDNAFLARQFTLEMTRLYGGTRLGRQEIDGALIDDIEGALWTRAGIEACRVRAVPPMRRVVVGVDPPASATGDACGIVAVGLGADGAGYVLDDASVAGLSPEGWAGAVTACAQRAGADRVIAEANNGGDMVGSVLRAADAGLPVRLVHASRGKVARAEPVAALYGSGRAFHVGAFPALEDELCGLLTGGGYDGPGRSPDRADALVWAMTELMLGTRRAEPRVRVI